MPRHLVGVQPGAVHRHARARAPRRPAPAPAARPPALDRFHARARAQVRPARCRRGQPARGCRPPGRSPLRPAPAAGPRGPAPASTSLRCAPAASVPTVSRPAGSPGRAPRRSAAPGTPSRGEHAVPQLRRAQDQPGLELAGRGVEAGVQDARVRAARAQPRRGLGLQHHGGHAPASERVATPRPPRPRRRSRPVRLLSWRAPSNGVGSDRQKVGRANLNPECHR